LRKFPFATVGSLINGISYVYSDNATRVADGVETQKITQDYYPGAVIYAIQMDVSILIDTNPDLFATFIDANVDARAWCEPQ